MKRLINNQDIYQFVAEDATGQMACYFIKTSPQKKIFLDGTLSRADKNTMLDFKQFGEIIASCYGKKPTDEVKKYLLEHYNYTWIR